MSHYKHKSKIRKLYILSDSTDGIKNINGNYILVDDTGFGIHCCKCSAKKFAKGDLITNNKNLMEECARKYGNNFKILFLGDDDMTFEKLLNLHDTNYGKVEYIEE